MADFVSFLKEVRSELRKVTWPTREQAFRLTALVLAVTVAMAIYLGTLDYIFAKLIRLFVTRDS